MELIRNGKKVEKVEFILENVNVIGVPASGFSKFDLEMVETENGFAVKRLDVKIDFFAKGVESVLGYGEKTDKERVMRLWEHNDIICIIVNYEDKTEERILVCWNEEKEFKNTDQTSLIDQNDDLVLSIHTEEFNKEDSLYNLYINKTEILKYLTTYIKEIQEKSKKTESNIGALNMLNRVAADIKSGRVGKVMF